MKNPLVESLTEILTKEFRDKPDARVLVFVRTRDLTMALEEFMNKDPRLKDFNAARCTGVQAAKDKGDNCFYCGQFVGSVDGSWIRFRSDQ